MRAADSYDAELAEMVAEFFSESFRKFGYDTDSWKALAMRPNPTPEILERAALEAIRARSAVIDAHTNS